MRLVSLALAATLAQTLVAADGDAKARQELVGTWRGRVVDGAKGHVLTISVELIQGKRGRQKLGEGSFTLDTSANPCRLDATKLKSRRPETYLGIYSLEGDTLKWCVGTPGRPRPTEFRTGGSQFYLLLKREKK